MQSTITLFRHLYKLLPPLFPADIKKRMEHALLHLEGDQTVSVSEIERTMIMFGYEVWPWNQAYREFLALAEAKVGEHFLLPKLKPELQAKYHEFKRYGGTLRDLHSGRPADYFTNEERADLCVGLVEMQRELREYVNREVSGLEKSRYLQRVEEFKLLLQEIRSTLDHLRTLADREQDHPSLAHEIRARVEHFEHGLCMLGPELDFEAVCNTVDFFHGRKQELSRLRGMHLPAEIDLYSV